MPRQFPEKPDSLSHASLVRRLVATLYDALICVALLLVTTGVYMAVHAAIIGTERYEQLSASGATLHDPLLSSVLFIVLYLFFGYFWTRTGQTLGMQVWHIRIQNTDGTSISWLQALMRFFMAGISWGCVGIGHLWMLVDKEKLTWQDRFSDTRTVRIPRRNH